MTDFSFPNGSNFSNNNNNNNNAKGYQRFDESIVPFPRRVVMEGSKGVRS